MQSETASAHARFDVKALRLATHGWLLGNPLVYKPGAADLAGIARELARAGSPSGTLVLGDPNDMGGAYGADEETAQAILLLRLAMAWTALAEVAASSIAEVAGEMFGHSCSVHARAGQWDVVMRSDGAATVVAHVSAEEADGTALLGLRFAFDALRDMERDADGPPRTPLLARSDWREVLLARALHALDMRLQR